MSEVPRCTAESIARALVERQKVRAEVYLTTGILIDDDGRTHPPGPWWKRAES